MLCKVTFQAVCFFSPIFWGPDKRPVQQPDKDNGDNVFFYSLTGRNGEDKQPGTQKQQNQKR